MSSGPAPEGAQVRAGDEMPSVGPANMAMRFVVLLGIVSLFADMTYEGARSISGPWLAMLGASATVVGVVAGLGELAGYGLRLVSGYVSDRTGRYWLVTMVGYIVNLAAVPLLALTGRWEMAAVLLIAERVGKAIRTPARDAMLSHATAQIGRGRGFGLHEALDQIGAVIGPLLVAGVLLRRDDYRLGFALLVVPALLSLGVLDAARRRFPQPHLFEERASVELEPVALPRIYWIYLSAVALVAAGYADFPLIAFHFHHEAVFSDSWMPVVYAVAMGVDALSALVSGWSFDRFGLVVLAGVVLLSSLFAPLVFLGGAPVALTGMALWGIGMGAQESIMRAAVAGMVTSHRRGSAYGVFNAVYGVSWFLGSALLGVLYDVSLPTLIIFSVVVQLAAIPVLVWLVRSRR
jgi:MFS family permease